MSSLANILLSRGYKVSGSDSKESFLVAKLRDMGAVVYIGQRAENISPDVGLVIYTAAIHDDNPELQAVRSLGIPAITRADFLGQIMRDYHLPICVSGTHGKTTTTSLISQVFLDTGADPTVLSGGIIPAINGNMRIGHSEILIVEACEYANSFHSFFPKIAVILNVRADHLDFFNSIEDIRASFLKFARLIPENGTLVINGEIDNLEYFTRNLSCRIVTFGSEGNFDYTSKNIGYDTLACGRYDLFRNDTCLGRVELSIPGKHNIYNSLAAVAVCDICGIETRDIIDSLKAFTGVERRFQLKGHFGGVTIVDDYAHHPDEIDATLSTAALYPHKKLWVVFQPHTYSRTAILMDEFAAALAKADAVVLPDIYAAREENVFGVSSKDLKERIEMLGTECHYLPTFDEVEKFLLQNCVDGDLLITMGAGDVVNIGDSLLGPQVINIFNNFSDGKKLQ